MDLEHQLVGYDRATERLAFAVAIPSGKLRQAAEIAGVPETDRMVVGSYPLDAAQAERIAAMLGTPVQPRGARCFLEPVALDA